MKVLHTPYTYFPDSSGGTEVYVRSLARELQALGVENLIAAPARSASTYAHEGVAVQRLATSTRLTIDQLYSDGDPATAAQFATLLDAERPTVLHLHAFTSAVSIRFVQAAKTRRIPVVLTYHTPTVSCARGTLLEWGETICDGRMAVWRCAQCSLQGKGMSKLSSRVVGGLPPSVGQFLGKTGWRGGMFTALRMSELMMIRQTAVRQLWQQVDAIVALCSWVEALLATNGVPKEKITVCRHGLAQSNSQAAEQPHKRSSAAPLRLVFLGRLHPTKGLDVLLNALQLVPEAPVCLDVYGTQENESGSYPQQLRTMAQEDTRVHVLPPVSGSEVVPLLRNYDMLVVPSQWLETGPLVVLEAFAAGIPVLGSRLGGIAEWVEHDQNGLLVAPYDEAQAWAEAFTRLTTEPHLLPALTQAVMPPRTMGQVAQEMLALYESLA